MFEVLTHPFVHHVLLIKPKFRPSVGFLVHTDVLIARLLLQSIFAFLILLRPFSPDHKALEQSILPSQPDLDTYTLTPLPRLHFWATTDIGLCTIKKTRASCDETWYPGRINGEQQDTR